MVGGPDFMNLMLSQKTMLMMYRQGLIDAAQFLLPKNDNHKEAKEIYYSDVDSFVRHKHP